MLKVYGVLAFAFSLAYLVFVKEKPPTPPAAVDTERTLVFDGLKHIFKQKDMLLLLIIFFFGLGMFNAVTTWIEQILSPRGFGGAAHAVRLANIEAAATRDGYVGAVAALHGATLEAVRASRLDPVVALRYE